MKCSKRHVPSSNIDLHFAHCSRNLERCKICGNMVPKRLAEEHFLNTHAPVSCSLCSETMDRECLAGHKGESCPKRIVTCVFCEFPLPATDLSEHQEVCGNRTELCRSCGKYIRLHEQIHHPTRCIGALDTSIGPSERHERAGESDSVPPRRQPLRSSPSPFSARRLLFAVAIAGIAVVLGSFLFSFSGESRP